LLGGDPEASAAQQEKLAIIGRSGEHLLGMINDILDLSKIEAGRLELREAPFDLWHLLAEISAMIQSRAGEKGLAFALDAEAIAAPYLSADAGKIRQILLNLLGNAVKFTDAGAITLRCGTEPIAGEPGRCRVWMEVADTGPGIPDAVQAHIFEPFVQGARTAETKGTGLGLAISKRLADLLGGDIALDSSEDTGTRFRVRFPAAMVDGLPDAARQAPRVVHLAPGQATKKILVVDDSLENRLVLSALLQQVGLEVLEAADGLEALEVFEAEHPDFIWMDMRMPRMDGFDAVRQIRKRPGGDTLPVVALTASAYMEQRLEILAAGCDEMIFKPYQEHEIFDAMARFLNLEYVYATADPGTVATPRPERLEPADLAGLPADLRRQLDRATLALDVEATMDVIRQIEARAPAVAPPLRALVQLFQIDRIRGLLREAEALQTAPQPEAEPEQKFETRPEPQPEPVG
jgi:CheY-like chemotaxis protein